MKTFFAFVAAINFVYATTAMAGPEHTGMNHGKGMMHEAGKSMAKMSEGKIKKVDKAAGKITIAHGPLENLNMPAMTMPFTVKDKAILSQVKAGDKIRFVADDVDGALTVTSLKIVK